MSKHNRNRRKQTWTVTQEQRQHIEKAFVQLNEDSVMICQFTIPLVCGDVSGWGIAQKGERYEVKIRCRIANSDTPFINNDDKIVLMDERVSSAAEVKSIMRGTYDKLLPLLKDKNLLSQANDEHPEYHDLNLTADAYIEWCNTKTYMHAAKFDEKTSTLTSLKAEEVK